MNILNNINTLIADAVGEKPKNTYYDTIFDIFDLFNSKYSQAFELSVKYNVKFFRGNSNIGLFVEREPKLRISSNQISNLYTRWFSGILPSWNEFPKRNRSFILSLSQNVASEFSRGDGSGSGIYWVLPENNANIGICPSEDIWGSFDEIIGKEFYGLYNTTGINRLVDALFDYMFYLRQYAEKKYDDATIKQILNRGTDEEILKLFEKTEQYTKQLYNKIDFNTSLSDEVQTINFNTLTQEKDFLFLLKKFAVLKMPMLQYFNEIFNPIANNFVATKINSLKIKNYTYPHSNEIWTDSKSLFIDIFSLAKMLQVMSDNEVSEYSSIFGRNFDLLYNNLKGEFDEYSE